MSKLCVIGDPIEHSLSPQIHNFFAAALLLPYSYTAHRVPAGAFEAFLRAAPANGIVGCNVTMPLKEEAGACLGSDPDDATVNTVVWNNGVPKGYSTDGDGFLSLLPRDLSPRRPVLLLGTGGAARSIAAALHRTGRAFVVCGRNRSAGECLSPRYFFPFTKRGLCEAASESAALVNATPLGMEGFSPIGDLGFLDHLPPRAPVFDLVYHPLKTELLEAAALRGLRTIDGVRFLIAQATLSFEIFTGVKPSHKLTEELYRKLTAES